MLSSFVGLLCVLGATPEAHERSAYLFQMQAEVDPKAPLKGVVYRPQPGDMVHYDDHSTLTVRVYRFIGSGGPLHSGIVFRKADGTLSILEAGTNAVMKVFIFDLDERLHSFYGTILIRRLKQPLSAEQSDQLTEFCLAQEGKAYAVGRLLLQATPL